MISIEKNTNAKECFEFNRPFRSIDLRFGKSNEILPQTGWDKRSIVWLDYDGRLDTNVLADVDTFCTRAVSGSLLAVSVNAETDKEPPAEIRDKIAQESGEPFDLDAYRLTILRMSVGDKVPAGRKGAQLRGKNAIIGIHRKILLNQVAETITTRNALLPAGKKMSCGRYSTLSTKTARRCSLSVGFSSARRKCPCLRPAHLTASNS